jgi:crossover junction endodeoxyribonuclease RuvC
MATKQTDRIILGIDPGTTVMGYGIIHQVNTKVNLVALGVLNIPKKDDHPLRLKKIFERTLSLIDEHKPDEMAIEAPFFGKNVQSMLKLGRAQGVAIAAAMFRDVPIFEYSPRKIKQSITGNGAASKEQVCAMLEQVLKTNFDEEKLDATDGLAAALCHYYQRMPGTTTTSYSGWESFIKQNQDRIKK